MTLLERTLFGYNDKVATAIHRIREYEPAEGYIVAFSGGKDSVVTLNLVKNAGVKYEAVFNVTTVDPPELLKFIRKNHPEVRWRRPKQSLFQLIKRKGFPPTRQIRYCCERLKEINPEEKGRTIITGIRWAESFKRAQRDIYQERYHGKNKNFLHPIIDWRSEDV